MGARREIDARTLSLISSCCPKLEKLNFACKGISSHVLKSALGSDALPLLTDVHVCNDGPDFSAINDEVALAIFRCNPMLEYFNTIGHSIGFPTCVEAILCCPRLVRVHTRNYSLSISSERLCEFSLYEIPNNVSLAQELAKISSSSRCLTCQIYADEGVLVDQDFVGVISTVGKTLEYFSCYLNNNPNDDHIMQHIAVKCSTLKALYLYNCNFISDHSLRMLADNCHSLQTLCILEAVLVTNFGVCYLVCKIGERLRELYLDHCVGVTDAVLLPLLTFCTQLETLGTLHSGITRVALRDELIIPNKLPLLKCLHLCAFVETHNAIDGRWVNVLVEVD